MYDYNVKISRIRGRNAYGLQRRRSRLAITISLGTLIVLGGILFGILNHGPSSKTGKTSALALVLPDTDYPASSGVKTIQTLRIPFEPQTLAQNAVIGSPTKGPFSDWTKIIVAPGDNLSLIFGRHGFSKKDLHEILNIGNTGKKLRHLKPGQTILFKTDPSGHVLGLIQELDYLRSLHIEFEDNTYTSSVVEIEPEIRYSSVLARIKQSLFLDGVAAGLADKTIMELTDIFGWDIDFVLDVRAGDQFSVVFEEIYKNGEKIKNGKILAAEFVNRGNKLRAVYYSRQDGHAGYYSDKGQAMKKAFLRAPVNFTRISSRFNLKRRHPILNTIRAHKGVDYAAPHGTPIRATASGKVIHAGNKGGYGRTVVIRHGDTYSTLFAHMSRFARGIRNGTTVKQGQTIGYVGKTGLATGPHLHYEFRINGIHRNPLKVALPKALPLEAKYIADFRSKAAPLLAQLDELSKSFNAEKLVAEVDPNIGRLSSAKSATR